MAEAGVPALGIFAWFRRPVPFAERMKMIRAAGFTHTSLWWEEDHPEGRRRRHHGPELVREAGLLLDHVHAPYRRCAELWSADPDSRAAAVKEHLKWIRHCSEHGIPRMVMHVNRGRHPEMATYEGVESLELLTEAAEEHGVTLCLENTRNPYCLLYLFDFIDSPFLKLCYDCSHDWLHSEEPFELLRAAGHRLGATHLGDTDGRMDRHWLPGEGKLPFDEVAAAWPKDWQGVYLLEVAPRRKDQSAEDFLREAYARGKNLAQRLHKVEAAPS